MLRHVSALTVALLQGAHKFLACAAYVSACVVGIVRMIELAVMNIQCYSF